MDTCEAKDKINWAATAVIIMGTFLQALTGSIVNVAISKLTVVLNTDTNTIQWVLTIYMLTQGIVIAFAGFLADKYGYKRMFVIALTLFTFGSFVCGSAFNFNMMILGRLLQGIGAGIIMPLGMAIVFRITPAPKVGMVIGVWGIAAMASQAIGPSLGGYLIQAASWRMLFYINFPIGLLAIFMGITMLPETEKMAKGDLDIIGIITICMGLFCLIFGLNKGNNWGWHDPKTILMLTVGVVCLVIMVAHELSCPEPILDMRLFKNKIFTLSTIISSIIQVAMIVVIYLFPILMQSVLGQTAMKTGMVLLLPAVATAVVMPISGNLFDKYGARYLIIFGMIIMTISSYAMKNFDMSTSYATMIFWLSIRGIGIGLALQPAISVGMVGIPKEMSGVASSLGNVVRSVAGTFSIAILTNLMQSRNTFHYANLAQNVTLSSVDSLKLVSSFQEASQQAGLGVSGGQTLSFTAIYKYVAQQSMVMAIDDCFIVGSILCLVAFLVTIFFLHDRKKTEDTAVMVPAENNT